MFGPRGRMGSGMMGPWGLGWFGVIFVVLIVLLVVAALIILLPRLKQNYKIDAVETSSGKSKAHEILKERYARGEIDKSEFEEKKKGLEESWAWYVYDKVLANVILSHYSYVTQVSLQF